MRKLVGFIAALLAAALVAAGVGFVAFHVTKPDGAGALGVTGVPSVPSITAEPEASPSAPQPPPVTERHDPVGPFMPRTLSVGKPGAVPLLDAVQIDQNDLWMKRSGPLRGWVSPGDLPGVLLDPALDWSVKPGTGTGTTTIWGHAESGVPKVFNPLTTVDPSTVRSSGYEAVLERSDPSGSVTLTYAAQEAFLIDKNELKNWKDLAPEKPILDRLLLITCNLKVVDGVTTDTWDNMVWVFTLQSSVSSNRS